MALASKDYNDPRWMSFKQANEEGFKVRKGEKSQTVIYYQFTTEQNLLDDDNKPKLDNEGNALKEKVQLTRPILKHFNVFNATQLEDEKGNPYPAYVKPELKWQPIEKAETILVKSGVEIFNDQRDMALYRRSTDRIHMPDKSSFPEAQDYYSVAIHELAHATGHESRLDRKFGSVFGSPEYAKEELRAEIGSWMVSQELGLPHNPEQNKSYVASWVQALKDDPYEIVKACRDAEKIKDFVLSLDKEITLEQAPETELSRESRNEDLHQLIYLDVPFHERELAAHAGAICLKSANQWIMPKGADLKDFEKWLPAQDNTLDKKLDEKEILKPVLAEAKVYLDVPFKEKGLAKEAGAKWDVSASQWYAPEGADLTKFKTWTAEQNLTQDKQASTQIDAVQTTQDPVLAEVKTYLNVPYMERNEVKNFGAKWDKEEKLWFAPEGSDLTKLQAWLPDTKQEKERATPTVGMSPEEEFSQALAQMGLDLKGQTPIMNGQLQRVPTIDSKAGKLDGAYVGHLDGVPAGFIQNFKTGEEKKWRATGHVLTLDQKRELAQQATERKVEQTKEQALERAKGEKRAYAKYMNATPAVLLKPKHPYLEKKGIEALGAQVDAKNNLLLIAQDVNGYIQTLQTINEKGEKRFEKGCSKTGAFFEMTARARLLSDTQKLAPGKNPILIAEGYATAASVHMATNFPVMVAFDSGNLKSVALALHEKFPEAPILILADNDHSKEKNVGLEAAKEAAKAVNGSFIAPVFTKEEKAQGLTDFNDLHQSRGLETVKKQLSAELDKNLKKGRSLELGKGLAL